MNDFEKKMKILVTGGSGFLGSHVGDALSDAGHEVTLFDLNPSPWLRDNQTMMCADILDQESINKAVKSSDVIYHLAALADINEAIFKPRETVEINLLGTLNLLEAARDFGVERFVFASSIYVYSDEGSFYRTSKQACELLLQDYFEEYGLDYTILRFGSLYGPRSNQSNNIYNLLNQAINDNKIEYYGTGEEIREYIHVLDAAAMSADILTEEFKEQIVHLTGTERMSSRELLSMIQEIMGNKIDISFQMKKDKGHYVQTPYSYKPKLGRRLRRNTYIDLGLGLLDCLHDINQKPN